MLEPAATVLERRTLRTTFVPVLCLTIALGTVAVLGTGWSATVRWWADLDASVRLVLAGVAFVWVLLVSQLLAVSRSGLFQLLEGYWDDLPFGPALAGRGVRHHVARHRAAPPNGRLRRLYPQSETQLLPTTFGNVLRGAERHSADRYALEAVTAWPRLYPTLPEPFQQLLGGALGELELAVNVAALGAAFAALGTGLALWLAPWYVVTLCWFTGALVAWLGYRAAVSAAGSYGQLFRAAFDVYRWSLVDAMAVRRPHSHAAEPALWRALTRLWVKGAASTVESHLLDPLRGPNDPDDERSAAFEPASDPVPPEVTTAEELPPIEARLRRRLVRLAFVLLLGVAWSGVAVAVRHYPPPVTAAASLPPYHVLAREDLRGGDGRDLLGRYTLNAVAFGARIEPARLGPRLPADAVRDRVVLAVSPTDGAALQWLTVRAAPVSLLVAAKDGRLLTVPGAIVLDFRGEILVVAVPRPAVEGLVAALADGSLRVLPG